VVDVVCSLGGTVTLSLSRESYVLTWSAADRVRRSSGGVFRVENERLVLRAHGDESDAVTYRVSGDTLAITSDSSQWDFDGDGEVEDAEFVAVMVRL